MEQLLTLPFPQYGNMKHRPLLFNNMKFHVAFKFHCYSLIATRWFCTVYTLWGCIHGTLISFCAAWIAMCFIYQANWNASIDVLFRASALKPLVALVHYRFYFHTSFPSKFMKSAELLRLHREVLPGKTNSQ